MEQDLGDDLKPMLEPKLDAYRVSDMEKVDFVAQLPRTFIHFDTFQGVILYNLLLHLFFWEKFWNLNR